MHLIFIRHGDPDYENDSLTEKGRKEAALLAQRIAGWNVTDFYCSPLGRAQETIKPALAATGRSCETMEWLKEFSHHVTDPVTKKEKSVCWDWMPEYFYSNEKFLDRKNWFNVKPMKKGNIETFYSQVCYGFDELLKEYDYNRIDEDKPIYNCFPHLTDQEAAVDTHLLQQQKNLDDRNLVFVCHLGVMMTIISHLTGISAAALWQSFFVAPSSVTVLGAEERVPGEVVFRIQQLGDISHLTSNGELPSASGFFGNFTDF